MDTITQIREKLQEATGKEIHPYYLREFVLPKANDYKNFVGKENFDVEEWVNKFRSDWSYIEDINALSERFVKLKDSFDYQHRQINQLSYEKNYLLDINKRYAKIIDKLLDKRACYENED